MLDEYLKRDDVLLFIREIQTNQKLYQKENFSFHHGFYVSHELVLYLFYDALLKYKIILNDVYLFDEYLEQVMKIFKKLNNIEDIIVGIHKLICRMLCIKFNIRDRQNKESRRKVITHVYRTYIENGYFLHGFHSTYLNDIQNVGFIPEFYRNYYSRFVELDSILQKYNTVNRITKDFSSNLVYFTDDAVLACYYSLYAPMFFSQFLMHDDYFNKRTKKDAYLTDNYDACVSNLKRFMNACMFSDADYKFTMKLFEDEWKLLHQGKRKICLLLVERKRIYNNSRIRLEDYLEDDSDLFDIVDRLLSPKHNSISYDEAIGCDYFEVLQLEDYYPMRESKVQKNIESISLQLIKNDILRKKQQFLNVHGCVSLLLLLGSFSISLGVLMSILTVFRG